MRRTFAPINSLESVDGGVRYRISRVKCWRNGTGQMLLRWATAACPELERRIRKIRGYRLLTMILEVLKRVSLEAGKEVEYSWPECLPPTIADSGAFPQTRPGVRCRCDTGNRIDIQI